MKKDVEQFTKADRHACQALRRKGKARATLPRLSSTVRQLNGMSYKMNPVQFKQVISLPAQERYTHFISRVADWQELWTLKGPDGYVLYGDSHNNVCIPIWPHSDYAKSSAKQEWENYTPVLLRLEDFISKWIPGMLKDGRKAAVFPTPNEKGIIVDPDKLKEDISAELTQSE